MSSKPVLWIDPGKMTGLATWAPTVEGQAYISEHEFIPAGDMIEMTCGYFGHRLAIGWEKFTIGPQTHKNKGGDAHYAIEMIGVARRAALKNGCQVLTPAMPADRLISTREMLMSIGWWVPGKDDAQSAAQHLLAWMLRTNCVPAREAAILASNR